MDFPIHLPSQLREHLRALRKARGLTQAALGQLLGVGQARIAEIENNPGVVSVDQLMKLLSALRASLVLRDDGLEMIAASLPGKLASPKSVSPHPSKKALRRPSTNEPPAGQGQVQPLPRGGRYSAKSTSARRGSTQAPSDAPAHQDANPAPAGIRSTSSAFIIRPKKGSW
ncbi:helix-turn-helix domain-containing protein [Variovorax sp. LARHSF232]